MKVSCRRKRQGPGHGSNRPPTGLLNGLFKFTMRKLKAQKVNSFLNIAGLAVGMACFIILALWIKGELSYDRFHENKDRIFRLATQDENGNKSHSTPWPLAPALKTNYQGIEDYCRIRTKNASLVRYGNLRHHEQRYYLADPSFFQIFSFPFVSGDPESALSELDSIVITEETASRYFRGANPIGKKLHVLQLNADFKVTGVIKNIPANSHLRFDLISRLDWMGKNRLETWEPSGFSYVLLGPSAQAGETNGRIKNFFRESIDPESTQTPSLLPLTRLHMLGDGETGADRQVFLFSALAVFILILACINFTNLSTARSIKTAKEVGIRKVIGATRKQLVYQFLGEAVLISFFALLIALALVLLTLPSLNHFLEKELSFSGIFNILICLVLLGLVLLTGVLAGSYPAAFLSSFQPARVLKGKFNLGTRGIPFRKILITFQFSVAVGFIICSLAVNKQLRLIKDQDLGFTSESVVMMPNNQELMNSFAAFTEELLEDPDILNVTAASSRPVMVREEVGIRLKDQDEELALQSAYSMVDFGFFETFGMEIIEGRGFSDKTAGDQTRTCVINESAARMMGLKYPLGEKIYFDHPDFAESYKELEIVGVVRDFHFRSMHQAIGPFIFRFYRPWHFRLFIKMKPGHLRETLEKVEGTFTKYAPRQPFDYEFLDDTFQQMYQSEIQMGYVFSFFGVLAICISCMGLFGLASSAAEQKTKEIGIRKVFGATVSGIVFSLSKELTQGVLLANLITWPIVYLIMNRWLRNFVYRINLGLDVFVFAALLTLSTALLTVAFKAVKAASANPVDPLRHE